MDLKEILSGVIRDAFFDARNKGETMYQASDDAAAHVLAVLAPSTLKLRMEVEALLKKWDEDRQGYPSSADWRAPIADAAVKLCTQELRAAVERAKPMEPLRLERI